jgi:hypothetical protein
MNAMSRIVLLLLVLFVAPVHSMAQVNDDAEIRSGYTDGRLNGYGWRTLHDGERAMYMRGAADALLMEAPINYGLRFPHGSYQEIAKTMDLFYANPYKRAIPLLIALKIIREDEQNSRGPK